MKDFSNLKTSHAMRLLIVTCLLIGLSSCGESTNRADSAEVLRRGLAGEPASLDPAAAADSFSFQVLQDLYEGLTIESANGEVLPAVASSWTTNETGTEYTFRLRESARWSNGKPVRAQEFVSAWRRVLDPNSASPVSD